MLSKQELEEIIKAWPDENGTSSNPELYYNWIEMERDHCRARIRYALGTKRIEAHTIGNIDYWKILLKICLRPSHIGQSQMKKLLVSMN